MTERAPIKRRRQSKVIRRKNFPHDSWDAYLRTKVEYDTNGGCWLWAGRLNVYGYGVVTSKRLKALAHNNAHRTAWQVFVGPIPAGLHVCHKCDVRACVNPGHLFTGTHADNMADMKAKGRAARVPSERNLLALKRGEDNRSSRLTVGDVHDIRNAAALGEPPRDVAKRYSVTRQAIEKVVKRKTWAHV